MPPRSIFQISILDRAGMVKNKEDYERAQRCQLEEVGPSMEVYMSENSWLSSSKTVACNQHYLAGDRGDCTLQWVICVF